MSTPIQYSIDSKIKTLDNDITNRCTEVKRYKKDSLIKDKYDSMTEPVAYFNPKFTNDTLFLLLATPGEMRVHLVITKDSCIVDLIAIESHKSDSGIKHTKYCLPCKHKSLTLVRKPIFKTGEFIQGIIELTSENYRDFRDNEEKKYRFQLKACFNIVIPNEDEKYPK